MNADNLETSIALLRVHGVERIIFLVAFQMLPSVVPSSLVCTEKRAIQTLAKGSDIFTFVLIKWCS